MGTGEYRAPFWHPVLRWRAFKVRHMLGEWWVDAFMLNEYERKRVTNNDDVRCGFDTEVRRGRLGWWAEAWSRYCAPGVDDFLVATAWRPTRRWAQFTADRIVRDTRRRDPHPGEDPRHAEAVHNDGVVR